MRRALALLFLLGLLPACAEEAPAETGEPPVLLVWLAHFEAEDEVEIRVTGAWRLTDPDSGEELESGTGLARRLPVRSARLPRPLRISPADGRVQVAGRSYRGDLVLRTGEHGTRLVLVTDLESYLPGVLAGEMGPRFSPAALRAQATMARTYAWSRMREREASQDWHVADDTRDQMFVGETADPKLHEAVERTRGMVLTWRSEPLPGYYHSTCGGHTANASEVFDEPELPPTVGVPCGYCSLSPRFRWSPPLAVSRADFQRLLSLPAAPTAVTITGHRRDGRIAGIRIVAGETITMTGEELRFRMDPRTLRSTLIHRIEIDGDRVLFTGGGSGHGVGLCQWGAEGMARTGASAADILAHYSPGAELGRIY